MVSMISINQLSKKYQGGYLALDKVDLEIQQGEIFALLGPNGAGKTTLISTVCGITNPSSGTVLVSGFDIMTNYRKTRSLIGLVPQELSLSIFETVWDTVCFSRGLFGAPRNDDYISQLLKDLTLWEKRKSPLMTLSGGMKRRVMIAKALSHQPKVLFLDEPTAGVDVELRRYMWQQVHKLRESGVTIILTTHYLEEAEEMADRVGVINQGQVVLVEKKTDLMKNLGTKQIQFELAKEVGDVPPGLEDFSLKVDHNRLVFSYDPKKECDKVPQLLAKMLELNIEYTDIDTKKSTLEEIFVDLVRNS